MSDHRQTPPTWDGPPPPPPPPPPGSYAAYGPNDGPSGPTIPESPLPTGNFINAFLGSTLFALFFGTLTGYFRLLAGFVIGLQGMLVGAFTGLTAGKWFASCSVVQRSFQARLILSLTLTAIVASGQIIGMGLALPEFDPGFILTSLWEGTFRELSIGVSRHTSFAKHLDLGWWTLFNLLDLGLMWLLVLACMTTQVFPDASHRNSPQDPGWSPVTIALLFALGFGAWWVGFAENRQHNRAVLAEWYRLAWAETTAGYLANQLELTMLGSQQARDDLFRRVDRMLQNRIDFPEGFATRAALYLQADRLAEAIADFSTAIDQARTLEREVKFSFLSRYPSRVYLAFLQMCRAKLQLKNQAWQAAADDFTAALATLAEIRQQEGPAATLPRPPHPLGFIVEYHSKLPDFTEGACYFGRALARARLDDQANAQADLAQARALGYDLSRHTKKTSKPLKAEQE